MANEYWDKRTIEEGEIFIQKNIHRGVQCPCCHQNAKLYYRGITSAMALALILIHKNMTDEYFHIEDYLKTQDCSSGVRGDFPKLRFWGFIEPKPFLRGDGSRRNGMYKITDQGKKFVEGNLTVPQYVKIYNNQFYGFKDDKYVGIKESLKNKFNYEKLMNHENAA